MLKFYVKYHAKFLAALAPFVVALGNALSDGSVSKDEATQIGVTAAGAALVYLFKNARLEDKPASRAALQTQVDALQNEVASLVAAQKAVSGQ